MRAGEFDPGPFERAVLTTVLAEIPDRRAALKEDYGALSPGRILAITAVIADRHFQRQAKVRQRAAEAGFRERSPTGGRFADTLSFEKPPRARGPQLSGSV